MTNRISTIVSCNQRFNFTHKRTMMSSRCVSSARTLYHCYRILSNDHILEEIKNKNYKPLINEISTLSLDHTKGTPQHKEAILSRIITHKYPLNSFYEPLQKQYPFLVCAQDILVDNRTIKELPVAASYIEFAKHNLESLQITGDSITTNFSYNLQSNYDFLASVRCLNEKNEVSIKICPHDEKGGNGMLKHTTRGSLGIVTYDPNNQPILTSSQPFTADKLIEFNNTRIQRIRQGLNIDKKDSEPYEPIFKEINQLFEKIDSKDLNLVLNTHAKAQDFLFNSIQCNANYNRSLAFIFPVQQKQISDTPQERAFFQRYLSYLPQNRLYNLDNKRDYQMVTQAAIKAYKETVDPYIIDKLVLLEKSGLKMSGHFLEVLSTIYQASTS